MSLLPFSDVMLLLDKFTSYNLIIPKFNVTIEIMSFIWSDTIGKLNSIAAYFSSLTLHNIVNDWCVDNNAKHI